MLIYDHEGLLEVEPQAIKQLCRSRSPVIFGDTENDACEVLCSLCNYQDGTAQRCFAAFHSKAIKRTLVYAVSDGDERSQWQTGQEVLAQLGFQLEDVNLKLSPAMLEVVLRDVPGLASPGEARRVQQERTRALAELQEARGKEPGSSAWEKADNKLRGEKRRDERALELRQRLDELLGPAETAAADLRALHEQLREQAERAAAAEARAAEERRQRELSESITAAAEKRIQELEASLVEMETISANALKQKRKITQLQKRVKELGGALETSEQEAASEQEKHRQSIADCTAAQDRIAGLEAELRDVGKSLEKMQAELAEAQAEQARLDECRNVAELRVAALDGELADLRENAGRHDEEAEETRVVRARLDEVQESLQKALERSEALERALAAAVAKESDWTKRHDQLTGEISKLREEYDRECTLRQHLEKSAAQNEKRIGVLKKSLAKAVEEAAAPAPPPASTSAEAEEVKALKAELQQQSELLDRQGQARTELESALHEAQGQIAALEETVRQAQQPPAEGPSAEAIQAGDASRVVELEAQLKSAADQLAEERTVQGALAKALAEAERQLDELRTAEPSPRAAKQERRVAGRTDDAGPIAGSRAKSSRPLPHELRPAPKKGAPYHPDWDLAGLPCASTAQIWKAWESAFNVQMSLEGYPSQYCMVYLVVLNLAQQKKLYLVYRLTKNKHTLVSVPAKIPHDEASLQEAIAGALKFLKMSGFEMEEISARNLASTLGSYLGEA